MSGPRFRIAPSPTGFFHVGGARTALYNWALARRLGGTFVLRIEDTDEARNRPEWTQGIVDALAWIGISADDPAFEGPYFQSHNAELHVAAAHRLYESGHAYWCDLTGEEIQARAKEEGRPGYGGWSRDRGLEPGPGRALRFRVPPGTTVVHDEVRGEVSFANETIEDFVLLRGNGTPVFILANVVDDIEMHISHVIRAEEHLPNTPKQQLLWEALGHRPPVWAHVPVVVNEQRKKLSKRRDKVALEGYRDEGYLAEAMVNYLMTLGWAPKGDTEIVPWSTIERDFRLEDVTHSPAFFDIKKLTAFNGEYIRTLAVDEFVDACQPFVHSATRAVAGGALRPRRVRRDRPARCRRASARSARCRRWSTSCSSSRPWSTRPPSPRRCAVRDATCWWRRPRRTARCRPGTRTSLKETLEAIGVELGAEEGQGHGLARARRRHRSPVGPAAVRVAGAARARETLRRMAALLEATPA